MAELRQKKRRGQGKVAIVNGPDAKNVAADDPQAIFCFFSSLEPSLLASFWKTSRQALSRPIFGEVPPLEVFVSVTSKMKVLFLSGSLTRRKITFSRFAHGTGLYTAWGFP